MKQRRDRLERAAHLTQTLWRLQQMQLAQREAELAEIRTGLNVALEALEAPAPGIAIQRLAFLSQRREEAEEAIGLMRESLQEYGARAKLAEKSYRKADEAKRREEAATELRKLSIVEVSAPKGS